MKVVHNLARLVFTAHITSRTLAVMWSICYRLHSLSCGPSVVSSRWLSVHIAGKFLLSRDRGMGVSSWPQAVWASSRHGSWVPRVSIPREPGGSCITCHDLASGVKQCHFHASHEATQIQGTGTSSPPRSGRSVKSHSKKHVELEMPFSATRSIGMGDWFRRAVKEHFLSSGAMHHRITFSDLGVFHLILEQRQLRQTKIVTFPSHG